MSDLLIKGSQEGEAEGVGEGGTGQKKARSKHLLGKSQPLPAPAGELGTEILSQGLSGRVNWAFTRLLQQAIGSVSLEGCKRLSMFNSVDLSCWLSRALVGDRPPKSRSWEVRHPWCVCACACVTTVSVKAGQGPQLLSHLIYSLSFLPSQMKRVRSVFQVP